MSCQHVNVRSEVCDQTLGVLCLDCMTLLAWCWQENHVPESLWNRCNAPGDEALPCTLDRDDHCALCEATIVRETETAKDTK